MSDTNPLRHKCERTVDQVKSNDLCQTNHGSGKKPDFILWGDSHADAITPGFVKLSEDLSRNGYLSIWHGCPPFFDLEKNSGKCHAYNRAVFDLIKRNHIKDIYLVANWTSWLKNSELKFNNEGWYTKNYKAEYTDIRHAALQRTIDELSETDTKIYIFINNPQMPINAPRALALNSSFPFLRHPVSIAESDYKKLRHETIQKIIEKNPKIVFIDPKSLLCKSGECLSYHNGRSLYYDDDHLSAYGAEYISQAFVSYFRE